MPIVCGSILLYSTLRIPEKLLKIFQSRCPVFIRQVAITVYSQKYNTSIRDACIYSVMKCMKRKLESMKHRISPF